MSEKCIHHKDFIAALDKFGVGACLCAAGAGMRDAFGMMIWKGRLSRHASQEFFRS
ncbi:MAG: hypothetical protein NTV82_15150 [Candidatus Aminicenantes bacterium]|nr:hypothetical protein [Candidatus Aminicenantes bacterium]